ARTCDLPRVKRTLSQLSYAPLARPLVQPPWLKECTGRPGEAWPRPTAPELRSRRDVSRPPRRGRRGSRGAVAPLAGLEARPDDRLREVVRPRSDDDDSTGRFPAVIERGLRIRRRCRCPPPARRPGRRPLPPRPARRRRPTCRA